MIQYWDDEVEFCTLERQKGVSRVSFSCRRRVYPARPTFSIAYIRPHREDAAREFVTFVVLSERELDALEKAIHDFRELGRKAPYTSRALP